MQYLNNISTDDCVGRVLDSKSFGKFKVINYENSRKVTVEFLETGYRKVCNMKELRTGAMKDTTLPSIYGVGFVGSKYKTFFSSDTKSKINREEYEHWRGLLRRCYSEKERYKFPTYEGCVVSDNFKSYEFFYEWCEKQIGAKEGFDLDKDLLIKGNKVYSEDTCVFLPREVNNALSKNNVKRGKLPIGVHFCNTKRVFVSQVCRNNGSQDFLGYFNNSTDAFNAYKVAKEDYLKSLAEKWKGTIDNRAYEALINYQVEITD